MIDKVLYINQRGTAYIVIDTQENYYLIETTQKKVVKGDVAELTKFGVWNFNKNKSSELKDELEAIMNVPEIVIDNRLAGSLQGAVIRNQHDFGGEQVEKMADELNKYFK